MINCYIVPTVIAKIAKHVVKHHVVKHAWRPIRRGIRHFPHHYLWHGVTIVCVGTPVVGWQMLPPTIAKPFFTPGSDAVPVNVTEPSTVFVLGLGLLLIGLIKWKRK